MKIKIKLILRIPRRRGAEPRRLFEKIESSTTITSFEVIKPIPEVALKRILYYVKLRKSNFCIRKCTSPNKHD